MESQETGRVGPAPDHAQARPHDLIILLPMLQSEWHYRHPLPPAPLVRCAQRLQSILGARLNPSGWACPDPRPARSTTRPTR